MIGARTLPVDCLLFLLWYIFTAPFEQILSLQLASASLMLTNDFATIKKQDDFLCRLRGETCSKSVVCEKLQVPKVVEKYLFPDRSRNIEMKSRYSNECTKKQ